MTSVNVECFLDTNVLIYLATGKTSDPHEHGIARGLVAKYRFGLSAQSLAEFYAVTRGSRFGPLSDADTDRWLALFAEYPLTPVDAHIVTRGIALSRSYRIHYYDAAMLAAAERLGAPIFYSEDLNHNQLYGSVRVINPFLEL